MKPELLPILKIGLLQFPELAAFDIASVMDNYSKIYNELGDDGPQFLLDYAISPAPVTLYMGIASGDFAGEPVGFVCEGDILGYFEVYSIFRGTVTHDASMGGGGLIAKRSNVDLAGITQIVGLIAVSSAFIAQPGATKTITHKTPRQFSRGISRQSGRPSLRVEYGEIVLGGNSPPSATGRGGSGTKCLHWCRSHWRKIGEEHRTVVRGHWRGDLSKGSKVSRYRVDESRLTRPSSG